MEINNAEFNFQPKVEQVKIPLKNIEMNGTSVADENHSNTNEDAIFFNQEKRIFGVFDGMSGESQAQLASHICSEMVQNNLNNLPDNISQSEIDKKLMTAFSETNTRLCQESKKYHATVGSTGTFGTICHDEKGNLIAEVLNVGDTRIYRFREGKLEQMTLDDGVLSYKYNENQAEEYQKKFSNITSLDQLTENEKNDFNQRNKLAKYLGLEGVKPTIYSIDLQLGDRLLLCTDGIHDNLTDSEIADTLGKNHDSSFTTTELIDRSTKRSHEKTIRSKSDDMTALIIDTKPEISGNFIPTVGKEITLQRSMGNIESGWKIMHVDGDRITVHKNVEGGDFISKVLLKSDIDRFNRPPKIEDISTSANFPQLIFTLKKLGGLQGSTDFFSSDDLLKRIELVRKGNLPFENITRTAGLRDKVKYLIEKNRR